MQSKMKVFLAACVILVCILACDAPLKAFAGDAGTNAAVAAADAWLRLVDRGKYAESWETAALLFRAGMAQERWVQAAGAVRNPLGNVVLRKLKTKKAVTSLPGAPDGNYVVILYDTTFENKRNSVETVTSMLEKDGRWRVSGYYIR